MCFAEAPLVGSNNTAMYSEGNMTKARSLANLVSGASTSTLPNSALTNSAITINGSSVSLGGSVTIQGETRPTFSSISPSVIEEYTNFSYNFRN